MKISTMLMALFLTFTMACSGNSGDHGHEHPDESAQSEDHGHTHEKSGSHSHEHNEQEEFTLKDDSATSTIHTHEDGSTHEDH